MNIFLGLIMAFTFLITFTLGSICNGLIRYPDFPLEHYFSLGKVILNFVAALVFTGIFFFLTPVFNNLQLLKKLILRLAIGNLLVCCILPLFIYLIGKQDVGAIIYSYYNWVIIIISLALLLAATYANRFRKH